MVTSYPQRGLLADLTAMRELCVQLDKAKDAHSRQVVTISAELEQVSIYHHKLYDLLGVCITAARKINSIARGEGCIRDTTIS